MKLNKYLAHAGVCSRRKASELIKEGLVTVNATIIDLPGHELFENDVVKVRNKVIKVEQKIYILLNKPKDHITTTSDQRGRKTVMELFGNQFKQRLYPVGRLDRNTTGLLIITNDGEFTQQLSHPKYNIKKTYHVTLDKNITKQDMLNIKKGVVLEDGKVIVDDVFYLSSNSKKKVGVQLHSGKYRVIRRLFKQIGYLVEKLDRVQYATLTKRGLSVGSWRFLTEQEIAQLKK